MGKEYNSYSITYRPYMVEFQRTKDMFLKSFVKKFGKDKYIVAPEKANSDDFNHFQIYLRFDKLRRQDTIKKSLLRVIQKFELTNEKVALKVNGISRDENFSIGYVLKEHKTFDNLYINGITQEELDKAKAYYLEETKKNKIKKDRITINKRNFLDKFKNYIQFNQLKVEIKDKVIMNVRFNDARDSIISIIAKMAKEDYYLMDITANQFRGIVDYLNAYYTNTMIDYLELKYRNGQ